MTDYLDKYSFNVLQSTLINCESSGVTSLVEVVSTIHCSVASIAMGRRLKWIRSAGSIGFNQLLLKLRQTHDPRGRTNLYETLIN